MSNGFLLINNYCIEVVLLDVRIRYPQKRTATFTGSSPQKSSKKCVNHFINLKFEKVFYVIVSSKVAFLSGSVAKVRRVQ